MLCARQMDTGKESCLLFVQMGRKARLDLQPPVANVTGGSCFDQLLCSRKERLSGPEGSSDLLDKFGAEGLKRALRTRKGPAVPESPSGQYGLPGPKNTKLVPSGNDIDFPDPTCTSLSDATCGSDGSAGTR